MSADPPTKSKRPRHRAGLTVVVQGALTSEVQEAATRAFAALATGLLLDEPMDPEVPAMESLDGRRFLAAPASR